MAAVGVFNILIGAVWGSGGTVNIIIGVWALICAGAISIAAVFERRRAPAIVGEWPACSLDPSAQAEVDALLTRGMVIPAIKRVRELTGLGLTDAKRLVDSRRR
jgi:hypothetical protein